MEWNNIFLDIAGDLKQGSKCVKLQVGCILVKNNRIISSGVNGTPTGYINCNEVFPNGLHTQDDIDKHHTWSKLNETHAEMNAVLSAANEGIKLRGSIIYVTTFPCSECLKNLIQLGIKCIYFKDHYSYSDLTWSLKYSSDNSVSLYKLEANNKFVILRRNK
jgi:dCMP deaminase